MDPLTPPGSQDPQMPLPPAPPQVPPSMQGQPSSGQDQQVVSPQEKQVLLDLIQKIHEKLSNVRAQDFAGKNKIELIRRELLKQVFSKLQLAGVDLTDRQSVADFISNLRQQSPLLADRFEQAMAALLGDPQGGGFATPQMQPSMDSEPATSDPSSGVNMNINQNENQPDQTVSQG